MSEQEKPKVIRYWLHEDSFFWREDPTKMEKSRVAKYDPDTRVIGLLPDMQRFRMPLQTHCNDKNIAFKEIIVIQSEEDKPVATEIPESAPPRPKVDPRAGDKSPKLIRWLHKYARQEFNARYGYVGRDEETGKPITLRKTPLSVQAEDQTIDDGEYEIDHSLDTDRQVSRSKNRLRPRQDDLVDDFEDEL